MFITIGNDILSIGRVRGYDEVVVIVVECLVLVELVLPYSNTRRHGNTSGRLEIVMTPSSSTSVN